MHSSTAYGDSRLSFWLRVRQFAVPPSVIETATARRCAGDWAGACAAAGIDVDLDLRSLACTHGRELAARIRADLRHLAPDLLRWHLPRIAPDGLLRPGLTTSLARYAAGRDGARPVHLVVRTPPAWADAGQRISLALWDGTHAGAGTRRHPHPRPHRRFRLDLHRHLWDARRTDELRIRSGAGLLPADGRPVPGPDPVLLGVVPQGRHCAVDRWAAEAAILLRAEGRHAGAVAVRFGARQGVVLEVVDQVAQVAQVDQVGQVTDRHGPGPHALRITEVPPDGGACSLPVLPDAATWVLPDVELLRAGLIEVDQLHPLVASALVPEYAPAGSSRIPGRAGRPPRVVECRGAQHRIAVVDGVLTALDHDPAEIRREELLAALTGTPLPCLQVIDEAHGHPESLPDIRARLTHGDIAGALAVVEDLLGPGAALREGALRDELEAAALGRITYGLFRAGLAGPGPGRVLPGRRRPRDRRSHPRHALPR